MAKVTALQYDHFVDRRPAKHVTFDQVRMENAAGNLVFLGVANNVPAEVAREFYCDRPDQFKVEWEAGDELLVDADAEPDALTEDEKLAGEMHADVAAPKRGRKAKE